MCRATTCKTCGRITWAGCGLHVAQVRARVPAEQWCGGHTGPTTSRDTEPGDAEPAHRGKHRWSFGRRSRD